MIDFTTAYIVAKHFQEYESEPRKAYCFICLNNAMISTLQRSFAEWVEEQRVVTCSLSETDKQQSPPEA